MWATATACGGRNPPARWNIQVAVVGPTKLRTIAIDPQNGDQLYVTGW
jgi:hypothetical protein